MALRRRSGFVPGHHDLSCETQFPLGVNSRHTQLLEPRMAVCWLLCLVRQMPIAMTTPVGSLNDHSWLVRYGGNGFACPGSYCYPAAAGLVCKCFLYWAEFSSCRAPLYQKMSEVTQQTAALIDVASSVLGVVPGPKMPSISARVRSGT